MQQDSAFSQVLLKDFAKHYKRLLREVHLSVTLAWNLRLFLVECNDFPRQNTPSNKNLDATNKNIKKSHGTVVEVYLLRI